MAEIRCPMCGKPNEEHLDECQHCGARLKPLLAGPGSESPPPEEPENRSDDWLRALRGDDEAEDDDIPEAEGGVPDWLSELGDPDAAESPDPEVPAGDDWLEGIRAGGLDSGPEVEDDFWDDAAPSEETLPQPPDPSITESGIERLAMFEDEPETAPEPEPDPEPEPEPESPEQDEPPGWVSGLHAVDTESAGRSLLEEADLPDWLSELEAGKDPDAGEFPAAEDDLPEEGGVPDWLSELGEKTGMPDADQEEVEAAGPQADWLSELDPEEDDEDELESVGPVPDWLAEFEKEAAGEDPGAALEDEDLPEFDSAIAGPDWLSEPEAEESPDWLSEFDAGGETEDAPEAPSPDWLSRLDEDEEPEGEPVAPDPDWLKSTAAAGPAWLSELEDAEEEEEPEAAGADWAAEAQEPDAREEEAYPEEEAWLSGFVDEAEEAPAAESMAEVASAEETAEEELPPWLDDFPELEADEEPAPSGPADLPSGWDLPAEDFSARGEAVREEAEGEDEVPDWLASALQQVELDDDEDLIPGVGEDIDEMLPDAEPQGDLPTAAELPDWLTSFAEEVEAPEEPEAEPSEEIPGWLMDAGEPEAAPETPPEPAEAGLPDWLQELHEKTPDVGSETTAPDLQDWGLQPAVEGEEIEPDAVDWMPGQTSGSPLDLLGEAVRMEEDLAPGEIPEWLKSMRMTDATIPGTMESGEADTGAREKSGPLAGLRGVLSAEPLASQAGKPPAHSTRLQLTEAQQTRANQLQKLVMAETEPQPAARRSVLSEQRVLRYLIAAFLFVGVLLPMLTPGRLVALPPKPPEMDRLSELISGLTPESVVLVAFDYQPALSGELDAAAAAVLDHVMLQNARLALVSTSPIGPALGERFVRLVESRHAYAYGSQYVNLGYIAGDATGLRLFADSPRDAVAFGYDDRPLWSLLNREAASPWNQPAAAGISRLDDFEMVILISDDPDTIRRWMEQVSPVLRPGTLAVIASAQAEPLVRPYLDSPEGRLTALVPGLAGGASYEGFLLREGPAREAWDGAGIGMLLAVILILGTGGYNLYLAWSEREAARAGRRG